MEEIEASAFLLSLDHLFRQFVVLFTDLRNILLADGVIVLWLSNHRLHGNLLEAEIRIMQDILGKVEIVMGKGTSHIVFLLVSAVGEFLEFRNDQIIASFSVAEGTHLIVNFLSSVQT